MTKLKIDANEQINTRGIVIFNKTLVINSIYIILSRDVM